MNVKSYTFLFIVLLFCSCLKEHEYEPTVEDTNRLVNEWIYSKMYNYYYWNTEIPNDFIKTTTPDVFFKSLLFKPGEEDRFSWITKSAQENHNMLHGVVESFGFEYALAYQDTLKTNLIGIVLYVVPNSPSSQANIKRGDVFYMVDNIKMTIDNYQSLLAKKKSSFFI